MNFLIEKFEIVCRVIAQKDLVNFSCLEKVIELFPIPYICALCIVIEHPNY